MQKNPAGLHIRMNAFYSNYRDY